MISSKLLLFLYAYVSYIQLVSADKIQVSKGDSICVAGYVMDYFCINRETLFDNPSIKTLSSAGPTSHSVHCLIDVAQCIASPFEVLAPLNDGSENFARAWRIDDHKDVVSHAKMIGDCNGCDDKNKSGLKKGYRATINATVMDMGSKSTPALISVTSVQNYEVGCGGLEYEAPSMVVSASGGEGGVSFATLVLIHGSLMIVGWGLLLPTGVIIAALAKHRPDALWFKIHKILQPFALLVTIAGFWVALQNFSALQATVGTLNHSHATCGVVTMVLGILQPISGWLRPHVEEDEEKSSKRFAWEVCHKGIGYSVIFLAVATIIMGTQITSIPSDGTKLLITYLVFVGVLVFLIIALLLDKHVIYEEVKVKEEEEE